MHCTFADLGSNKVLLLLLLLRCLSYQTAFHGTMGRDFAFRFRSAYHFIFIFESLSFCFNSLSTSIVCGCRIICCSFAGIAQCVYILEVFVGLHVIDALVAAFSRPMSRCTLTGFPLSLLLQHFAKLLVFWQIAHLDPQAGHVVCPTSWGHLPPQLKQDLSSCGMSFCFGRLFTPLATVVDVIVLTVVVCYVLRTAALFRLSGSSSVFCKLQQFVKINMWFVQSLSRDFVVHATSDQLAVISSHFLFLWNCMLMPINSRI